MDPYAAAVPNPNPFDAADDQATQARRKIALALIQRHQLRNLPPVLPQGGIFGPGGIMPRGMFSMFEQPAERTQPRPYDPLFDARDSGGVNVPTTKTNDPLWNSLQPIDPVWGRSGR